MIGFPSRGIFTIASDEHLDFRRSARQAHLFASEGGDAVGAADQGKAGQPRILIVEDEPLIALMLTDMLSELGFTVAATVTQVPEALAILDEISIDAALLDVNLGTQKIDPVADVLAARGTPFVFTTGYGNAGVPAGHVGRAILQKPFHIDDLAAILRNVLGTAAD